jgi:hypothetical protein
MGMIPKTECAKSFLPNCAGQTSPGFELAAEANFAWLVVERFGCVRCEAAHPGQAESAVSGGFALVIAELSSLEVRETCRMVGRSLRAQPNSNDTLNAEKTTRRIIVTLQSLRDTLDHMTETRGRKGGSPAFLARVHKPHLT